MSNAVDSLFKPRACLACGKPLRAYPAQLKTLCDSAICAWKFTTTPEAFRCSVCRRVLNPSQFGRRTCASDECNRDRHVHQLIERSRKEKEELDAKALAWREACAQVLDLRDAPAFDMAVVPHNSAADGDVSEERRDSLRTNLLRVAREAMRRRAAERVRADSGGNDVEPEPDASTNHSFAYVPSREVAAAMLQACIGVPRTLLRKRCGTRVPDAGHDGTLRTPIS